MTIINLGLKGLRVKSVQELINQLNEVSFQGLYLMMNNIGTVMQNYKLIK